MMATIATPLWAKCENETHTPKSGNLESSGTPKNSELDCRGENTSHWGVLYTVGKVLKFRCPKWPCTSHLDICSLSYGQKKDQESNWQFDSRPLKVRNQPDSDVCRRRTTWSWKSLKESYKITLDLVPIEGIDVAFQQQCIFEIKRKGTMGRRDWYPRIDTAFCKQCGYFWK
jgi:hypothetical protein